MPITLLTINNQTVMSRLLATKAFVQTLPLIWIVVSSCSTLQQSPLTNNQIGLNTNNLQVLNGCYNRFPNAHNRDDAKDLHQLFSLKFLDFNYENEQIKLEVLDNKHIRFDLFVNDTSVYTKVLKGKIENNEFEFNRRVKLLPIITSTMYFDSKVRIGILDNSNLMVDACCLNYGLTFFIVPFVNKDRSYNQEFIRVASNRNQPLTKSMEVTH